MQNPKSYKKELIKKMYRVDRNNFYNNEKCATVYTPAKASEFLFEVLNKKIKKDLFILDPCVGAGNLLKSFKKAGYKTLVIDIEYQDYKLFLKENYLNVTKEKLKIEYEKLSINNKYIKTKKIINTPDLVIMNLPFNIDGKTKEIIKEKYGDRPLLPEIWLQKTIELFGKEVPMLLFSPYGFRLSQTAKSKRWQKFINGEYPEIKSIISLPKDLFTNILFHSEILIFNVEGLKGHYFYTEKGEEK